MQERVERTDMRSKIQKGVDSVVDTLLIMGTVTVESFAHPRGTSTIIYNSRTREIEARREPPKKS